MYSTIVVGTDGSETASRAVTVAADLARRTGAVLHLVKAFSLNVGAGQTAGLVASDTAETFEQLAEEADDTLKEAEGTLEGITVERHAAPGPPADRIVAVAEEVHADLIVVGSRGMHRRVLGSVPNSVAHNAPCTVLIVKTT